MAFTFHRLCLSAGVLRNTFPFKIRVHINMNFHKKYTYEGAIYALNCLQNNSAYLDKARLENPEERRKSQRNNIAATCSHLQCLGIELDDLDSLNIIHVAGTKGKGSTCAFVESILRHHGLKTGFYSSPHLISVNERVRICGKPLSKEIFSQYFWHVFDTLQNNLKEDEPMPFYFMFLTVMSFYVFIKEKVDVAIVEVGIGGLWDCTNVIRKPVCVGVTTLDHDHVHLLGNTLSEIALQKAGIFKSSCPAFSVPQPKIAMTVLHKHAQDIGCSLHIAPPFDHYGQCKLIDFGLLGCVQNLNASLAIQLAHTWLQYKDSKVKDQSISNSGVTVCGEQMFNSFVPLAQAFNLSQEVINGVSSCSWPGRFQIVKKDKISFFLDGAHVPQSIKYCAQWFEEASQREQETNSNPVFRVLLFNATGTRNIEGLLDPLVEMHFDLVCFCPNKISEIKDAASDQSNFTVNPITEIENCQRNQNIWTHLIDSLHVNSMCIACSGGASGDIHTSSGHTNSGSIKVFSCIRDVMDSIKSQSETHHVQVLVTGSLHLVGGVLSVIGENYG